MAVVAAIVALLVAQRSSRCAIGRSVRAQRAAVVSGGVRCVSWERWTWPAHRHSRLRHRSAGFHRLQPDHAEADLDWLSVVHQGGAARAFDRMMPAFGDELTEATDRPGHRSCPHVLRRAGMAARRPESAETVRHRESVSRERSGPHHDDCSRPRALVQQSVSVRASRRPARPIRSVRAVRRAPDGGGFMAGGRRGHRRCV